jgi:hypothetical protein
MKLKLPRLSHRCRENHDLLQKTLGVYNDSEVQAEAIHQQIEMVIGMGQAIGDRLR